MLTAFVLFNIVITSIAYFLVEKYKVTEDSKLELFQLIVPVLKKAPARTYYIQSFIIFFLLYGLNLNGWNLLFLLVIFQVLQAVIHIDLKCFRLPNEFLLPSILVTAIVQPFVIGLSDSLLGGLIGFGICLVLGLLRAGGLGGGDVKLAALIGLLVGMENILYSLAFGFIIGGLFSWIFLSKQLIHRKEYVPYGPYFYIGFLITFFATHYYSTRVITEVIF